MDNKDLDILLDKEIPLLIPAELLDDYVEAVDNKLTEKTRATSLRRCLEGAIKLFYTEKMISGNYIKLSDWNRLDLNDKIELIGENIDEDLAKKFHQVRKLGNKGAHFDSNVKHKDVDNSVGIINEIVEDLFVKYFEKYKFGTQAPVMTILSALPPIYRVKILERLWENDCQNLNIIDKLSMAYLKSGQLDKSLDFLQEAYKENHLNEDYYQCFVEKIMTLNKSIDKFDISKNVIDTARISNSLIEEEYRKEYADFIHIFSVLINGYINVK